MLAQRHLTSLTRVLAVGCLAMAAAVPTAGATVAHGPASPVARNLVNAPSRSTPTAPARRVVAQWNAIAVRTIVTEGLTSTPVTPLYLSFTQVAMYDAVVAVRRGFTPYALKQPPAGSSHASAEVAAFTAAYTVLRHYFPASAANLDANDGASLALVRDGRAKELGIIVGQAAAQAIIDRRVDDGRDADVTLTPGTHPGQWRPTPPTFAPMLVPWLGFVRPMVLNAPTQLLVPGPRSLDSLAYARDFREVKRMGAVDSATRTPRKTETALFYTDNPVTQYQATMRQVASDRHLGLLRDARMFALVDTGTADAIISCWRAKYHYASWRPVTAIPHADNDGNPATIADPTWTPLVPTPPYPEYPSGHACVTGSVARGLSYLFGARHLDIDVSSIVTGTTRHYRTAHRLNRQTQNARIWLGLHFRTAVHDANRLGQRAARYVAHHAFGRS